MSGVATGTVWALTGGPTFLGRDSSNQVEVKDVSVSRKHCSVTEVSRGFFEIADLDSHNGTFVNGSRVTRKIIEHGNRIRVGQSEYVFLIGPDDANLLAPAAQEVSDLKT